MARSRNSPCEGKKKGRRGGGKEREREREREREEGRLHGASFARAGGPSERSPIRLLIETIR